MDTDTLMRELRGAGDTALTIGKNAAMQIPAGWAAVGSILANAIRSGQLPEQRDVRQAVKVGERMQSRAGGPKTAEGARNLEAIGEGIRYLGDVSGASDAMEGLGKASPAAGGALLAGLAAVDPGKLSRTLRGAKQATLPGIKALGRGERAMMELDASERGLRDAIERAYAKHTVVDVQRPGGTEGPVHALNTRMLPEGRAMMDEATQARDQARNAYAGLLDRKEAEPQWARMDELRAGRSPTEALAPSLAREEALLRLKLDAPVDAPGGLVQQRGAYFNLPEQGRTGVHVDDLPEPKRQAQFMRDSQRAGSRNLVRQLRQAQMHMDDVPEPQPPAWVVNLTERPSDLNNQPSPAGRDWWNQALGIDPDAAPESVAAFLRAVKDQPDMLTYGGMPKDIWDLESFADEFGQRAGKRIRVDEEYGSGDEPYKIETEKTHGRGEWMRDRYGDYKEEVKVHEPGDSPMYDEQGNVKKIKVGLDEQGDPIKKKRVAEGGETYHDEYGDRTYIPIKSEGGEYVRDDRGNIKMIKEDNPDYEEAVDKVTLSVPGDGEIVVSDWNSSRPSTYAIDAGKSGALLYQTLLAHASKNGIKLGSSSLTDDNALRLLSNATANFARTGVNPRDVTGTGSGNRPRARGFASGDRLWQALAGEADKRIKDYGGDPNAIAFGPEGFSSGGVAITPDDIAERIKEFSPDVSHSKVGQKTLMQNAVYKWLENASPEQAEQVVRDWPKRIGKPLFGIGAAGTLGAGTLADLLRQDQEAQQ